MVRNSELKEILIEELEAKKPFEAQWNVICDGCGLSIVEGEEFFFFGDKKKICSDCKASMIEVVEAV